jgi:hypothetical protein
MRAMFTLKPDSIHPQIITASMSVLIGIIFGVGIKLRALHAVRRVAAAADIDFVVGMFLHSLMLTFAFL